MGTFYRLKLKNCSENDFRMVKALTGYKQFDATIISEKSYTIEFKDYDEFTQLIEHRIMRGINFSWEEIYYNPQTKNYFNTEEEAENELREPPLKHYDILRQENLYFCW